MSEIYNDHNKSRKIKINPNNNALKKNLKTMERMPEAFKPQLESLKVTQKESVYDEFYGFQGGNKLKFRCRVEEWKRKSEAKRRKYIQKLQKNYKICVDGFNKNVTDEIIRKMEFLEKENREREQKHLERTMLMVKKLLEEQKYRKKGLNFFVAQSQRKELKTVSPCPSDLQEKEEKLKNDERDFSPTNAESMQVKGDDSSVTLPNILKKSSIAISEPCSKSNVHHSEDDHETEEFYPEKKLSDTCLSSRMSSKSAPLEKHLESTPKKIVFENYRSGEIYLQNLRIRNTSLESIHCRYLGIAVHTKFEGRFPIGVAVRDSIKLRPGLSCSTKIRLCSTIDTKELECSIVYETRRQKKPLKHSFFFVPVLCLPSRAIVQVFPLKIRFPCLTWCAATAPESNNILKKTLIIKNSGGRECWCKIVSLIDKSRSGRVKNGVQEEVFMEEDEEIGTGKSEEFHPKIDEEKNYTENRSSSLCQKEFQEEENLTAHDIALCLSEELLTELLNNVFATFRFEEKYCIVIPPFSTKQIDIRFIPEYKGFHQETYVIQFEGCHNCTEIMIELTGDIEKLPLVANPEVVDLKICIINSGVYSASFRVFNTSKGPYSVCLKLPKGMMNHAHVYPKGTILQASSSYEFSVRFYPRLTLKRDVGQYFCEDSGVLEFPIFIHPVNSASNCKTDSIKIYVFAVITDYCLELSPLTIDFGFVSTLETVRTSIKLTNHSLVVQEFGFLNLPKGVRVEPNMGFGFILPKETIVLFLLYSPSAEIISIKGFKKTQKHSFEISVTCVTEYGGFGEKFQECYAPESVECIWDEMVIKSVWIISPFFQGECQNSYKTFHSEGSKSLVFNDKLKSEKGENFDDHRKYSECNLSQIFLEMQQKLLAKGNEKENKIRNYLNSENEELSEDSFFKRINWKSVNEKSPTLLEPSQLINSTQINPPSQDDLSKSEYSYQTSESKIKVIQCEAFVYEPYCQLSESVILLPPTPCSSFSLYRFRLKGSNQCLNSNCTCLLRQKHNSKNLKGQFQATFQFRHSHTNFTLEPQSGCLKAGESIPITIVYTPEFSANELCRESRVQSAKKLTVENLKESSVASQAKSKKISEQSKKTPMGVINASATNDTMNSSFYELDKYDLFAGERSLQRLMVPFFTEARINCLIKIEHGGGEGETIEIHDLVLICPAIKPKFIYKGTSQEIDFGKVFIGSKARNLIEIENISFERIRPIMSLTNPKGPFACLSALRMVFIDPEHVLRHPLIYCPSENEGLDKEFFEIYCGSTNIRLLAKGEAIKPLYKIIPNYGCCIIESKIGSSEEFKLDIENLNQIKMKISFLVDFAKEEADLNDESQSRENYKENISKAGSADKKRKGESEKKIFNGWNEIPEEITQDLKKFRNLPSEKYLEIFEVVGAFDKAEVVVPPLNKITVKIKFTPPTNKHGKGSSVPKKYAINYKVLLEKSTVLKDILVIGVASK